MSTAAEEMMLDFDGWLGRQPPDVRGGINAHLKASGPAAALEKQRLASMYVLSQDTGLDPGLVNERWDTVRGGYAEQRGGDWIPVKDDEAGFHARLVKDVTRRRDLRIQNAQFADVGAWDALYIRPDDFMTGAGRAREAAESIQGFEKPDADAFLQSYQKARLYMEALAAPLRPAARRVYDRLSQGRGTLERYLPENQAAVEGAIDELADLPEKQRGLVIAMLGKQGGNDTTSDIDEKAGKAAVRGLIGQFRGLVSSSQRATILEYQKELEAGDVRLAGYLTGDFKDVKRRFREGLRGGNPSMFDHSVGITGKRTAWRTITPEESEELKAIAAQALTRSDVAGQAVAILEGTIDPVKTSGVMEKLAVDTGASLGAMAPIAIPYVGVFIAQGGYADQEYQRQRANGMDAATAHRASQITGAVQAGIERVGFLFNFAPASVVGRLAPRFTTPALAASFTAQTLAKMGTVQAAEYGEEIFQAAAPIMTAKLGETLGWELPEQARFEAEIQNFKREGGFWRPDVYMTVGALSLFGGGYRGVKNTMEARADLARQMADPVVTTALGIPAETARSIAAMPEDARPDAFRTAYAIRDVTTPEAVDAQREITRQVDAGMREAAEEGQAMQAAGISLERGVDPDGAPVWTVTNAEGVSIPHADHREATATMRAAATEAGLRQKTRFYDAFENFTAAMEPGSTIQFTNETGTLLTEADAADARMFQAETDAERRRASADLTSIFERANVHRRERGQADLTGDLGNEADRAALRGLRVYGKSETEFREGIARSVLTIYHGGRIGDVMEEWAEATGSRIIGPEGAGLPILADAVRHIEQITGDTYLHGEATNAAAVKEAWSDIVRISATGTRNGNRMSAAIRGEQADKIREVRRLRDNLNAAEAAAADGKSRSIFGQIKLYFEGAKAIMRRAARLERMRREGNIREDVEALIRRSAGLDGSPGGSGAARSEALTGLSEARAGEGPGATFSVGENKPLNDDKHHEELLYGRAEAGRGNRPRPRPRTWARDRKDYDRGGSAAGGSRVFEEIHPGFSAASAGGIKQSEIFGAEISAVAAGRKPAFHDVFGEHAAPLAEGLRAVFPELHIEAFDGHLLAADAGQLERMGASLETLRAAARSDGIGEYLGYGAEHRTDGAVQVRFHDSAGDLLAGFNTHEEGSQEFIDERERDYTEIFSGIRTRVTVRGAKPAPGGATFSVESDALDGEHAKPGGTEAGDAASSGARRGSARAAGEEGVEARELSNGTGEKKAGGAGRRGPGQYEYAKESMEPPAALHQSRIARKAPGVVYMVNGVKFDGFDEERGVLLEVKGPGYDQFIKNGEFIYWFKGDAGMVKQAKSQNRVAGGTPIEWHFAEKASANLVRKLFQSEGIGHIPVLHTP